MDEITDKEKLLKNIRNALIDKVENPFHDLDLDSSLTLYELGLSNPNNLIVTIYSEQDMETPE